MNQEGTTDNPSENTNEPHTREAATTLLSGLVHDCIEVLRSEENVLGPIERGEATEKQWRTFATARYQAALSFEDLLRKLIVTAIQSGETALATAAQNNLADELGLDARGAQDTKLAHHTWREDFYHTLGISNAELKSSETHPAAHTYSGMLSDIITRGNMLTMAGALLVLEGSIPAEFRRIQTGMDKTFPEKFLIAPGDSDEVKREKMRARKYIDDHIKHDAAAHYPDLLRALLPLINNPQNIEPLSEGARKMTSAKKLFYETLAENF